MLSTLAASGPCSGFLAAIRDYQLVDEEQLLRLEAWVVERPNPDVRSLATSAVRDGVLTHFQAGKVLQGLAKELAISDYRLVDILGTGSMGTVYKARSIKDGGWYAIKIVRRRNVVNLRSVAQKAQVLKHVRHPRVSALVALGAVGERVYLVWPFLADGTRLDTYVERSGQLPVRQAAQIALQIASGLQPFHEAGLFHGLLKPSDILIGSDRRVRVLDFGVGFLLATERGKSLLDTMTNTKAIDRGLDCASPESIVNPLDRTPAGDQYSLGCILYYCLSGQFPFPDPHPVRKMIGHQTETPVPIQELNVNVPPRLAAIVDRLLQKQPAARYGDTGEVIAALQAVLSDRQLHSAPVSPRTTRNVSHRQARSDGVAATNPRRHRAESGRGRPNGTGPEAVGEAASRPVMAADQNDAPTLLERESHWPEWASPTLFITLAICACLGAILGWLLSLG